MPTPSETFLANPDVAQFVSDSIAFLNATWPQILSTGHIQLGSQHTVSKVDPIEFANAASSGSCATACASAVLTNVQGLSTAVFSSANTKAQFFLCGKTAVVLNFAMTCSSMTADVNVQGYSAISGDRVVGLTLPVSQSSTIVGSVSVTLPWTYQTGGPQTVSPDKSIWSVSLWPVWSASVTNVQVPDAQLRNVMNDAIANALSDASEAIVQGLRGSVSNQIQTYFERSYHTWTKHPNDIRVPMPYVRPPNVACTSSGPPVIPNGGCDPCDTCCQCYAQQSCKGYCADCPCLQCSQLPRPLTVLFASLVTIFTLAYLYGLYFR